MPAILGYSPFVDHTPGSVYWSKVSPASAVQAQQEQRTGPKSLGHLLEPVLVNWAAEQLEVEAITDPKKLIALADDGIIGCDLDARIKGRPRAAIEGKYVSIDADQWGESGGDEVPAHVRIQVAGQCHAAKLDVVFVAAAIVRPHELEMALFVLERNDRLIGAIVPRALAWWKRHVETRQPPPEYETPPADLLKVLKRREGTRRHVDPKALDWWLRSVEARKVAEITENRAKLDLIHQLGDAEIGFDGQGNFVTFLEQPSTPKYNRLKMQADGIFHNYAEQGTHRQLRHTTKAP